jgi:DNA-binding HxlR family transcriptional regulator
MPHPQVDAAHRLRPQARVRCGFTELRKAVPGVTAQVLTRSLRALERDGIVVRRYFPEVPPCVEYGLTDLSFTLCEPVGAIRAWAEKVRRGHPHRPTTLRTQQGRRLESR